VWGTAEARRGPQKHDRYGKVLSVYVFIAAHPRCMRQHAKHEIPVDERAGYLELLQINPNYRRLWIGSVISFLGDWFNLVALYTLVSMLTGSPLAIGAIFIAKMLPWALSAPLAGLIVDRFNRRRLMIGADVARGVIVIGFLFISDAAHVPLLYVLIALEMVVGSVYQPAKSSSIPNITKPRELLTANALSSATWSTMLAVGAALGGFTVEFLGVQAVFIIDSVTYFIAAWFIYRTHIPQQTEPSKGGPIVQTAAREIWDGWQHLRRKPRIGRIALAKASWAAAGGGLVYMLTLLGEQVSPGAIAAGMGVLFMARGIGTGIGPVIARAVFTNERRWPTVLGAAIAISGVFYASVGLVPWDLGGWSLALLIGLVVAAHASSGSNWVLATVLLQKRTEDRYRGRVFATEWLLVMIADTLSILMASLLLELEVLSLSVMFVIFALAQVAFGVAWLLFIVPRERRAEERLSQTDGQSDVSNVAVEAPDG